MNYVLSDDRIGDAKMSKLRLGDIADNEPAKLTVELPATVHRDLIAYTKAFAHETGQPIADSSKLVAPTRDQTAS